MRFSKGIFCSYLLCFVFNFAQCISFTVQDLELLNYKVDILKTPVMKGEEQSQPIINITSKYGQEYQCYLQEMKGESFSETNTMTERNIDMKQLLKPMQTAPCLLKGNNWWTYEFCFGRYIRQFHDDDGQNSQVITLGLYQSDYDWNSEPDSANLKQVQQKYHSQYYTNGTHCDLTGKPRNAEVRFYCEKDARDYIYRIDEPGTCSYVITVHSSRVCSHPQLKPAPSNKAQTILCHPLLTEEQYSHYSNKFKEYEKLMLSFPQKYASLKNDIHQQFDLAKELDLELSDIDRNIATLKTLSGKLNKAKTDILETLKQTKKEDLKLTDDHDDDDQSQSAVFHDDYLQVRMRRLGRKPTGSNNKLYEMDVVQRKKLEQAVNEKLDEVGWNTEEQTIEMNIISTGFYDDKDEKGNLALSDEEIHQYQNMIMALLTGQQEAFQETERHKKLEENYKFVWRNDDDRNN